MCNACSKKTTGIIHELQIIISLSVLAASASLSVRPGVACSIASLSLHTAHGVLSTRTTVASRGHHTPHVRRTQLFSSGPASPSHRASPQRSRSVRTRVPPPLQPPASRSTEPQTRPHLLPRLDARVTYLLAPLLRPVGMAAALNPSVSFNAANAGGSRPRPSFRVPRVSLASPAASPVVGCDGGGA